MRFDETSGTRTIQTLSGPWVIDYVTVLGSGSLEIFKDGTARVDHETKVLHGVWVWVVVLR